MVLFLLKDLIVLSEIVSKDLFSNKLMQNGLILLPTITKQYNNKVHSSTKLTPIQASLKKNEGYVYKILLDKRKKKKAKYEIGDLVRTADLKKNVFQIGYNKLVL